MFWRPLALQGRSWGPLGPFVGAFLGLPEALLAALGALLAAFWALPGGPGGPRRLQIGPGRHKKDIPGSRAFALGFWAVVLGACGFSFEVSGFSSGVSGFSSGGVGL